MAPRVVCISQARMGSTRLPGKVMLPILGRPLLAHHLERLRRARRIDAVAVATTDQPDAAPILALCRDLGVSATQGSESDVLDRFHRCAVAMAADVVVRVTSDCPLIAPELVDAVVARFLEGGLDYASLDVGSYPRGFDVEVFSRAALDEAAERATDPAEREHVTPYIYRRPGRFRIAHVGGGRGGEFRLCVDDPRDLELVRRLYEILTPTAPAFGWRDCVDLLERRPELAAINRDVAQKAL